MKRKVPQLIILLILCFGIGYLLNYYFSLTESVIISLTGALITFLIGYFNFEIANDKIFKDLFQEFNCKYDLKFNKRLNDLVENKKIYEESEDNPLIIDYLNFCAEEYLWKSKGRIVHKVWLSWKDGMNYFIMKDPIKKVAISEIRNNNKSYYGFFDKEFPELVDKANVESKSPV